VIREAAKGRIIPVTGSTFLYFLIFQQLVRHIGLVSPHPVIHLFIRRLAPLQMGRWYQLAEI
jgi:hypothetical protein